MTPPELKISDLLEVQAPSKKTELSASAQCRHDTAQGTAVIEVPELWPEERASVRLLARSRHQPRYFAKLHTLHQPHPQRVQPSCAHHGGNDAKPACGGCPWMSLDVDAQRAIKTQVLSDQFNYPLAPIRGGNDLGYRYSSKRIAGRVRGRMSLGSYVPRTHHLAPMQECKVDHPLLTQAFASAQELLISHRVAPFDEQSKQGEVRYLWGKCSGQGVHITAIGATIRSPRLQAALLSLASKLGPGNAVSWQLHPASGNAIKSENPIERIDEFETLPELELLGRSVALDALGFLQPNPQVAQLCYRALLGLDEDPPPTGALALDLYAGGGATSLSLATRFTRVMACEQRPPQSAAPMVQAQSAEEFLKNFNREKEGIPDLVVANPPRSGLSETVCHGLSAIAPPRIAIMSCGPTALAKNLQTLGRAGYQVTQIEGFDPLPHTAHVEVVAHLRLSTR